MVVEGVEGGHEGPGRAGSAFGAGRTARADGPARFVSPRYRTAEESPTPCGARRVSRSRMRGGIGFIGASFSQIGDRNASEKARIPVFGQGWGCGPVGRGRRSRKSRARAFGAPARASRVRRSLGRVQAAFARVASRFAPRGRPSARTPAFSAPSHQDGDPASRSRRRFFPGGARSSASRAEAARRARGGGLPCGRGRGALRAGPAPPFVGASRRPPSPPRRIPHRCAASVLPARPRPLRLVAHPCGRSRAAADGTAPACRTTCCKLKLSDCW